MGVSDSNVILTLSVGAWVWMLPPSHPLLKLRARNVKPPPPVFENLVGSSTPPPPSRKGGGEVHTTHYLYFIVAAVGDLDSKELFRWRWAGPVRQASSPKWFLSHVHMESSSISVQSKSLCCCEKIVWSSSFYNKQWRKAIIQNKCSYII